MKMIRFAGYLFYSYYSGSSGARSPYFSTICAMTFLGFLHLVQILILLNKAHLIPINLTGERLINKVIIFFMMLPVYFVMTRLFKKSDIAPLQDKYDKDWDKVFAGNVWLIIYCILSVILVILLACWIKQ